MKTKWLCLILMVILSAINLPVLKAEAAGASFKGTYEQVRGFIWEADGNTITFNGDGTFNATVNMYEGYYQLSGTYSVNLNQAFCTVTSGNALIGKTFTMTDINGNLAFEAEERLITIESGAVFKNSNAPKIQKSPWEDAYMNLINSWKDENSSFSFALYDVDEDQVPEMFISSYGFTTVFTCKNGESVELGTMNGHPYMWNGKNSFIAHGGFGTGAGGAMLYKIENGQLSEGEIEFYWEWPEGAQSGTYIINGRTVTEDEYKKESKVYINPARAIYTFYCYNLYHIIDGTRLADYVTAREGSVQIKVLLDGKEVSFDQPPVLDEGRTLVPLRAIFEALGGAVSWDDSTKTIKAAKGGTEIIMQIGNQNMSVNGNNITLDVPPKIINGRSLVPVRAVAEGFSAGVDWEDSSKTVFITSNFYDMNVNNLVKNKAYSVFINPTAEDGHKVWEYNYKDDLNMTQKEYEDYVNMTTLGAALVEAGVELSEFDFGKLMGDHKKDCMEDAITRLLIPSEEELQTIVQKNLEGIAAAQKVSNGLVSIGSDILQMYKEVHKDDMEFNNLLKDMDGKYTDYGLSVPLSAVNDTITELVLLKTIADTFNIIGENYEQFINSLSVSTVTADKELIVTLSKEIIEKNKKSTRDQIISAFVSSIADNAIKEAIKALITSKFSADQIQSLKATIVIAIFKFCARDFIEASNSWLAFAGMNSIQSLAAAEYEVLLSQAKSEKMPLTGELQERLRNSALVYIMSSIKCRNLLYTTVEKSHPKDDAEPFKNRIDMRNNTAYQAFNTWKNAQIIAD